MYILIRYTHTLKYREKIVRSLWNFLVHKQETESWHLTCNIRDSRFTWVPNMFYTTGNMISHHNQINYIYFQMVSRSNLKNNTDFELSYPPKILSASVVNPWIRLDRGTFSWIRIRNYWFWIRILQKWKPDK